jgi:hypothetical protein
MADEFKTRALEMFELSEERLDELEESVRQLPTPAKREAIMRESIRNATLRELLGKDNRDDEIG